MTPLHDCRREKEIDKLVVDVDQIKKQETKLELIMNEIKNDLRVFKDDISKKLDEIKIEMESYQGRLTKLEKTWMIIKWVVVGMILMGLISKFGIWNVLLGFFS